MTASNALSVRDLRVQVSTSSGPRDAVEGVSFDVAAGSITALIGESGSGKTLTASAVMGLLPRGARVSGGRALLRDDDLLAMGDRDRRALMGRDIAMVFQDPMTALNPVRTVGRQMAETITRGRRMPRAAVRARSIELLGLVRIPRPADRLSAYPHQFSGGMRQRVMIAMALAHSPSLLIADEPTTALDVTIQASVMGSLEHATRETGTAVLLITHDLGVAAELADRMIVMYGGTIIESGSTVEMFDAPQHPYTASLQRSRVTAATPSEGAFAIAGAPPTIEGRPTGCVFAPRCPVSRGAEICTTVRPVRVEIGPGRTAACHFPERTAELAVPTPAREGAR